MPTSTGINFLNSSTWTVGGVISGAESLSARLDDETLSATKDNEALQGRVSGETLTGST